MTTTNKNEDRDWVYTHVVGEGEIVLYGSLMADLEDLAPTEFWRTFRKIGAAYLTQGPSRTQVFHQQVDQLLEELIRRDQRFGYPAPFCRKGCANCCHEPVYCTSEEAGAIRAHCLREGIAIDDRKLERQLRFIEVDGDGNHTGKTTWNHQEAADQSCVFLDPADRSCRIWPVRPFVCRVHLVEATDRFCRPHNGTGQSEARAITYPEWSYVLSVIFTIHWNSIKKTMGRLLLDLSESSSEP